MTVSASPYSEEERLRLMAIYGFCWICRGPRHAVKVAPRPDGSVWWFGCIDCGTEAS